MCVCVCVCVCDMCVSVCVVVFTPQWSAFSQFIHENIFRLIQIHCYDFTHWDSQQWWLTLFCNGDIVHNANYYNDEFVNT